MTERVECWILSVRLYVSLSYTETRDTSRSQIFPSAFSSLRLFCWMATDHAAPL